MLEQLQETRVEQLHNFVIAMKQQGYRFVTMTCLDGGADYEILYHFDKQYTMKHLKVILPKGGRMPSISCHFFSAVLVENEIKDMFGVQFDGLAIDYEGRFLLAEDSPKTPLNKPVAGIGVEVMSRVGEQKEGGANHGS